jgi:hypothetical protein
MKKIIISFSLLLLAMGCKDYSGTTSEQTKVTPSVEQSTQSPDSPKTKLYTNNQYHFKIASDEDTKYKINPSGFGKATIGFYKLNLQYPPEHPFDFSISIDENFKNLDAKAWFISRKLSTETGMISGAKGSEVVDFKGADGAGGRTLYYFHKNRIYIISNENLSDSKFETILSSLAFTD